MLGVWVVERMAPPDPPLPFILLFSHVATVPLRARVRYEAVSQGLLRAVSQETFIVRAD